MFDNTATQDNLKGLSTLLFLASIAICVPQPSFTTSTSISGSPSCSDYNKYNMEEDKILYETIIMQDTSSGITRTDSFVTKDDNEIYLVCNLNKLQEIARLPDNWNYNGAKAFSESLIKKMHELLLSLKIQPEIFPGACNTIQLEYDKNNGAHLEIEINENLAEVFMIDDKQKESLNSIIPTYNNIKKVVEEFYG